jgi:hypothetical protein
MLDHRQRVLALPTQRDRLQKVTRHNRLSLAAQERAPGRDGPLRAESLPASLRIRQTLDAATLIPSSASSPYRDTRQS